jgi:hypothetical protein
MTNNPISNMGNRRASKRGNKAIKMRRLIQNCNSILYRQVIFPHLTKQKNRWPVLPNA